MTVPQQSDAGFLSRTLEAAIRIGFLLLLATWCFQILRPFVIPVAWGAILAILAHPGYRWLRDRLRGRSGLAATLLTLLALVVLITPTVMLAGTLVEFTRDLARDLGEGTLQIPPPPETVGSWPIVGEPLESMWSLASTNLSAALREVAPQLGAALRWLLSTAAGTGLGILQFVLSIIIAGVLLAQADKAPGVARAIGKRLAGDRGEELVNIAGETVQSVARGILGVALIQSVLAALGFLVVGVPGAGLWALLILFLAVIQIPPTLILIPIVIYVFSIASTFTAVAFLIWSLLVGMIDNVLKPIFLGRGVRVPMVVIFIGAIGGFMAFGVIGLFVGSVVLAVGYELFLGWLDAGMENMGESGAEETS